VSRFEARIELAGYGKLTVVEEVAIDSAAGEIMVVLGSNGAGKSTTLRAVMGTVRARRQLRLDAADLSHVPAWALPAQGIVLVPDGARCFPNLTVGENLEGAFIAVHGAKRRERYAPLLEEILSLFPALRTRQKSAAGTLSGGQRQMLAVGRALMAEPRVLLLDEPSAGLAPKVVEELFQALSRIKAERGCAIVMAEQNVGYASAVADRCIVLEEGRVVLSGAMAEVIAQERLRTAYLGL
jgi:branched-chain amino acid transport system ATP-binding protein